MSERVRTTISVSPEALEVFKRMAEAANISVSRCMGDWLSDTVDAAQMITIKMEEAKRRPQQVLREMRALVAGMGDSVDETADNLREASRLKREGAALATPHASGGEAASAAVPPSSNTGGKSTKRTKPTNWKTA